MSDPHSMTGGLTGLLPGGGDPMEQHFPRLETYLTEVATEYERMGFEPPAMKIEDGDYILYFYDYADTVDGVRFPSARARSVWTSEVIGEDRFECFLEMDSSRAFPGGKDNPRLLEYLAHELFHCVQSGHEAFRKEPDLERWIIEGTAQALGQDMAFHLRGITQGMKNQANRLGGRPYHVSLMTDQYDDTYRSASFWRYLGEYEAAKRKNGRPGVKPIRAEYSYLAEIFSETPGSGKGWKRDLEWVNAGLRRALKLEMDRLFPAFISTFAGYAPERLTLKKTTPDQARTRWLDYLFTPCLEYKFSAQSTVDIQPIQIAPMAARCVTVESDMSAEVTVTFQVQGSSRAQLEALKIGSLGGESVKKPLIVEIGDRMIGAWKFYGVSDKPQTFIISNAATDPLQTPFQAFQLEASFKAWASNMTPAAAPAKTKAPAREETRTASRNPSRDAAKQAIERGLENPSAFAPGSTGVGHDRDAPECPEPFRFLACGPSTRIQLRLMPGTYGSLDTAGHGGPTGQLLASLTAIADVGPGRTTKEWMAAMLALEDQRGSQVILTIPQIDYGFTGSFSNAAIVVNSGDGGDPLQARGPADVQPGRGHRYPLSGRVTIEEFTPLVLRGTFSATLTRNPESVANRGPDDSLPVAGDIEGMFIISAPWENDQSVKHLNAPDGESARRDLSELFPGMTDVLAEADIPEAGSGRNGVSGGSGSVTAGAPYQRCDCSCGAIANLTPRCEPVCEVAERHCTAQDAYAASDHKKQETRAALADMEPALREDFREHLEEVHARNPMADAFLDIFDDLETFEEKRLYAASLGMSVSDYMPASAKDD